MSAKTKFQHAVAGETYTRTSHHEYTHVVVARDERKRDHEADFAYLADQPERYASAVADAKAREARQANDFVISWHRSEAAAAKAAHAAVNGKYHAWTHARVEAVNGGVV